MAKTGITQDLETHINDTAKHGDLAAHDADTAAHKPLLDPINATLMNLAAQISASGGSADGRLTALEGDVASLEGTVTQVSSRANTAQGTADSALSQIGTLNNTAAGLRADINWLAQAKNNCRAVCGVVDVNSANPYLPGVAANNVWFWIAERDPHSDGDLSYGRGLFPGVGQRINQDCNRVYYICVGWE